MIKLKPLKISGAFLYIVNKKKMFLDRRKLKDLYGLVGFHNANNPNYPNLVSSLLSSRSGLYVNDAHGLITIENIDQSIKNFNAYNYDSFSTSVRDENGYSKGSKVSFGSVNYEYVFDSVSTSLTPDPDSDITVWRVIDNLSDYLIKSVYSGIDRLCDKYMNGKKYRERAKSIFENVLLFNDGGDINDLESNNSKFVGLRIRFKKKEKHLVAILNKIGHQFSSDFDGLEVKLYHESKQTALATFTINHSEGLSFEWTGLTEDNILRYFTDKYGVGDFYIGYKQSDLEALNANAVNKNINWDNSPITSDDVWRSYYKQYSKYLDISGFSVDESEMVNDKMFDVRKVSYDYLKYYGLNLNLTLDADLTPFFLQEERTVAHALKYNVAMVLMESMAYNTRGANQLANQIKSQAEKQLFHHKEAFGTLADLCRSANDSLSFDFSDMDNAVMPSDSKFTLKARSGSM